MNRLRIKLVFLYNQSISSKESSYIN